MSEKIVATDHEHDAGQDLEQHPSCTAALERRQEMADPAEDQQPADEQRNTESCHCGLDDREHSDHDEQDGSDDEPAREAARGLEARTFSSHAIPSQALLSFMRRFCRSAAAPVTAL